MPLRTYNDSDADVDRPALVADLAALLRPDVAREYAIVVGETGSGKSTAVRQAVSALPSPTRDVCTLTRPSCCPRLPPSLPKLLVFYAARGGPAGRAS